MDAVCATSADCLHYYSGYGEIHLVGRTLSALFETLTLVVIFGIGSRLFDRRVGLMAALLGAAAVLPIQQAHFFTVDGFLTFFVALAFYAAVRVVQATELRHWVLFGLAFGMALACKISVWPLGLVLVAAALLRLIRRRRDQAEQVLACLLLAGLFTFAAFRVFQPYAFAGPNHDANTLGQERFDAAYHSAPEWWRVAHDILPGSNRGAVAAIARMGEQHALHPRPDDGECGFSS